jgi:hypothetical protein
MQKRVILYLRCVLEDVENYVDQKQYLHLLNEPP